MSFSKVSTDLFFSIASFLQSPREISPFIKKHTICSDMGALACTGKFFQKNVKRFEQAALEICPKNIFSKSCGEKNLFSGVRVIDLSQTRLQKAWVQKIKERFPNVSALVFPNVHFTESVARSLQKLPSLTALNLFLCNKVDPKSLQALPNIRTLSFTLSPYIFPPLFAMDVSETLPWEPATMEEETVVAGEKVDDAFLQDLAIYAPKLESLYVEQESISGLGLQAIGTLTHLRKLFLNASMSRNSLLNPTHLIHLKSLKNVTDLSLHMDDEGDAHVIDKLAEFLPQLKKLSLLCRDFPNISQILRLEHLESLSIKADQGLKKVSVHPIASLQKLKRCTIGAFSVDMKTFDEFSKLKQLKILDLHIFSAKIDDFVSLQSKLPMCTIRVNYEDIQK